MHKPLSESCLNSIFACGFFAKTLDVVAESYRFGGSADQSPTNTQRRHCSKLKV
jgi:hypothetical protein